METTKTNILASYDAMLRRAQTSNAEWEGKHWQAIVDTLEAALPRGAGIVRWSFDHDGHYVYGRTSYHKMTDAGAYNGWIDFGVKIRMDRRDIFGHLVWTLTGAFGRDQDLISYGSPRLTWEAVLEIHCALTCCLDEL